MTDKNDAAVDSQDVADRKQAQAADAGNADKTTGDTASEAVHETGDQDVGAAEQSDGSQTETAGDETDPLEQLKQELANQKDAVLRAHAEVQNVTRRAAQDVEKAHKYGQEKLVSELLPVIDNLERALQAVGDEVEGTSLALKEGVELTLKSFIDCLTKFNVEAVDPVGEPFDPQYHQAMSMVESDSAEPNSVVAVVQKGYILHGRVLRPAMVMVAKE